ncbi:MAG: hypothetical protein KF836_07145 [Fimbriimonadaceae bacterium]|nr:hypothetical protein [Fimbriimonadaceae bacterium]
MKNWLGRMGIVKCLALAISLSLPVVSLAQSPDADILTDSATLVINGVQVFTLKTSAGGLAPTERANVISKALWDFRRGQTVSVVADPGLRVALQGKTVVTITVAEAKAQGVTPDELAESWARAINKALYVPPLVLQTENINLVVGKSQEIKILGSMARTASILVEPSGALEIKRNGYRLSVKAMSVGEGQLIIKSGDLEKAVPFSVMAVAANLPQNVVTDVTGSPASKELVLDAIRGAVSTMVEAQPGARISFDVPPIDALTPGSTRVYQVAAKVEAPGFYPSNGTINVTVRNLGGGRVFEDFLWYSNEPENVRATGQLYYGRLQTDSAARLLWHHCNKSSAPLVVQYVLANRSAEPARVWLITGDSEPNPDPTKAGFNAGNEFFSAWLKHQGTVVTIPPRSVVPIVLRRMANEETVSGLATLRLLPGGSDDVVMVANAIYPPELPVEWSGADPQRKPWLVQRAMQIERFTLPLNGQQKLVFSKPLRQVRFDYEVGGKLGFVRIGQESIASAIGGNPLSGNFGVQYFIEGKIANNTNRTQIVEVMFEASAGYSGALFSVNGGTLFGKMLQSKQEISLYEKRLAPGESQDVRIETIPLSGAHYPATITVRTKGMY